MFLVVMYGGLFFLWSLWMYLSFILGLITGVDPALFMALLTGWVYFMTGYLVKWAAQKD